MQDTSSKQQTKQKYKTNHQQTGLPPHSALPIRRKTNKQTNKNSAQISPYTKLTQTTGPTLESRSQKEERIQPWSLWKIWKWKFSHSVMSNSLWPHRLQTTRLLHPQDFTGKSTGMGCHFLLQRIFLTQGMKLGLSHCRQTLYHLNHQGSQGDLKHNKLKKIIMKMQRNTTQMKEQTRNT